MKKTWCIGLLLLLPLILKAQIFEEDGYQLTRMTNLSHEINKVDAEGFSMSGLCFAHFEKGDLNFMNITIGTTTPYDFEEEHCSVILVFLEVLSLYLLIHNLSLRSVKFHIFDDFERS